MRWPFGNVRRVKTETREREVTIHELNDQLNRVLLGGPFESAAGGYHGKNEVVGEIIRKYRGIADRGNQLVQRIVDTRAAFALGGGLDCAACDDDRSARTAAFIRDFLDFNNLDAELAQQLAKEKEFEGQVLLLLDWDDARRNVRVDYLSWYDSNYRVLFDARRPSVPAKLEYKVGNEVVSVDPDRFVFFRFNARLNSAEGIPTLAGLLVECENVDRALRDWRSINNFHAAPTPFFHCKTREDAKDLQAALSETNWKIGKALAATAEFRLVGPDMSGVESLRQEIETNIKLISAGCGVPVQFLGFPEFMSNRATAENTMEPVELVAASEQKSWIGGFEELFDKAIRLANTYGGMGFSTGVVKPRIPFVTGKQLRTLERLYLPLVQGGLISLRTFLSLLPGVDAAGELRNLAGQSSAMGSANSSTVSAAGAPAMVAEVDNGPITDMTQIATETARDTYAG